MKPGEFKISGYGDTHSGRKRTANEDAIVVDNELGLYAVFDGVGGHAAGEVASTTAAEALQRLVNSKRDEVLQLRESTRDSEVIHFIEDLLYEVCAQVYLVSMSSSKYNGMGTTCTALLLLGGRAVMGHIGDSRLYIYRDEVLQQLSDDHTFANEMHHLGLLDGQEAESSRNRHVLTRVMGREPLTPVDTLLFDMLPEDLLILCTDGLSKYLSDCDDFEEFLDDMNPKATVDGLISFANSCGGRDNISVVAVSVQALTGQASADERRSKKAAVQIGSLTQFSLFHDLPYRSLLHIAQMAELLKVPADTEICTENQIGLGCYALIRGHIKKSRHERQVNHPRRMVFGAESIVEDLPSLFTVTTQDECEMLFFDSGKMDRLFRRYPRLGQRVMSGVVRQLGEQVRDWFPNE